MYYNKDHLQTQSIYFQNNLKFLMKWKWKQTSLIIKFHKIKFKNKTKRKKNSYYIIF